MQQLELSDPVVAMERTSGVSMFERLATDPSVDVAKLEKLIEMHERVLAQQAKVAFNTAFVQMQPEIPTIDEESATDKTTYAPLEDIIDVVRPILGRHGFSLSFETTWPEGKVHVVAILTHVQGHERRSAFLAGADQTGSKNAIQALGSTESYGKRYATKDVLCIVTRKRDDDGNGSNPPQSPEPPKGYDDWRTDMEAAADNGMKVFGEAWTKSNPKFRDYAVKYQKQAFAAIKAKAAKASAA